MPALRRLAASPHVLPVIFLCILALAYWSKVLFTGQVLLPGAMLRGFAPFGADAHAPWNILQWDALGQYYPWRLFAARQLRAGLIPLWNPHQFAGTPFLANGQSAVFYPLNLPFWVLDVASAFGVAALLHTLLAALATYCLAQRWQLSRAASLVAAIAFSFGGYLTAWIVLPTLADTASWLPLLLLCLEAGSESATTPVLPASLPLALTLGCALLAGHAQIFFYLLVALLLRALSLPQRGRACRVLLVALAFSLALDALQLLPTLELARLGHRAGQKATPSGWQTITRWALQPGDLLSLFIPNWPLLSFSENFGYMGVVTPLLCLIGGAAYIGQRTASGQRSQLRPRANGLIYALPLALLGLLYATATPLAELFYFVVPGLSQMGGVGRALLWWSFGAALGAGYGVDGLRRWWQSDLVPALALIVVIGELFAAGWNLQPTAPRATIYPDTQLTRWLQEHTRDGSRILCLTPRHSWLFSESFELAHADRSHPIGVLPPNGALVYGLYDVNGYDSLAPAAYRNFVAPGEVQGEISPQTNGNMILLNNIDSPALDALNVRYIVSPTPLQLPASQPVLQADDAFVYARTVRAAQRKDGSDFFPGWRQGRYQPEVFRYGTFITLCALAAMSAVSFSYRLNRRQRISNSREEKRD